MKAYVIILLFTAFASVGALYRPKLGIYAYILYAVLRPHFIWGFAGSFAGISEAVGFAALIGWMAQGGGSFSLSRGRWPFVLILLYALWLTLSGLLALNATIGLAAAQNFLKILMPLVIGMSLFRGTADARTLTWIIVGAQGYVGLEMNYQWIVNRQNWAGLGFGGMDNNCFGVSLVATVGPALALLATSRRWWERGLALACALLILHTVLLTFSRGAMLGLLVVFATGFVLIPKTPKLMLAMVLVLAVTIRLTGPELYARFESTFVESDERDYSAESRIDLWRDCFTVAMMYPFFGAGPDNWPSLAADFGWPPGKEAHSIWMQGMAELGFPGISFLALFYLTAVLMLWRVARPKVKPADSTASFLAFGVILSIAGFMVAAMFVTLQGLETPYYTTLAGVALLSSWRQVAAAAAVPVVRNPVRAPMGPPPTRIGWPSLPGSTRS